MDGRNFYSILLHISSLPFTTNGEDVHGQKNGSEVDVTDYI